MTTYAGEVVGKREHFCIAGGNAIPLDVSVAIRKLGNNLPQDPVILLGIYPKDAQLYHKDMCSPMFTAALFVIARTWKQPKCPLTEDWIKKMWYIYIMEYYTAEKNNDILKFAGK